MFAGTPSRAPSPVPAAGTPEATRGQGGMGRGSHLLGLSFLCLPSHPLISFVTIKGVRESHGLIRLTV